MRSSASTPLLVLVLGTALTVAEARKGPFIDEQPSIADPKNIEEPEYWSEKSFKLPSYPDNADLLEFQVDTPNPHFRYLIDTNSLEVGVDRVIRYTLVIESATGARNIAFEGIHCASAEYKAYAYGNNKGELIPSRNQEWHKIKQTDYAQYRYDLVRFYMCDAATRSALTPDQIINAIKYKSRVRDQGFL